MSKRFLLTLILSGVMALVLSGCSADIEAKESNGETPLDSAVSNNSLDVARLLIDHGANTEGVDLSWMD